MKNSIRNIFLTLASICFVSVSLQQVSQAGDSKTDAVGSESPFICSSGKCVLKSKTNDVSPTEIRSATNRMDSPPDARGFEKSKRAGVVWRIDLRSAVIEARRQSKPLYVNVSSERCHYCVKMKNETYSQRSVIDQINNRYIAVHVDPTKNRRLLEILGVTGYPTVAIISPQLEIEQTLPGFKSAAQLTATLSARQSTMIRRAPVQPRVTSSVAAE